MLLLRSRTDVCVEILERPTVEALASALPLAHAVVLVGEQPVLTREMIERAPRLLVAARMGAGFDNFDIAALTARGIPLITTGSANAGAVAEHALYLLLAVARQGPTRHQAVKAGRWQRTFGAIELAGKTCLVVGMGRIGHEIARRATALDMRVIGVDPRLKVGSTGARGVELRASLEVALPEADVVVLACALTAETRGMISDAALARMKPTAFLINVARGPIVDESALALALAQGRLAGAGLDVLTVEPPSFDNPLLSLDNVVFTPHVASHVATVYERMSATCVRSLLAALDGKIDRGMVVNGEVLG